MVLGEEVPEAGRAWSASWLPVHSVSVLSSSMWLVSVTSQNICFKDADVDGDSSRELGSP